MMILRLFLTLALGVALVASSPAANAAAGDVAAAAKAAGIVGEQGDGFLGLVTGSAPPDVKAAVDAVNAGRAQAYKDIAARTGVSEQAAGEATARTLFAKLPLGAYYKPLGDSWMRK